MVMYPVAKNPSRTVAYDVWACMGKRWGGYRAESAVLERENAILLAG